MELAMLDLPRMSETGETLRPATLADLGALVRLVNSAYRGDSSRAGWTHEADLLGGVRTTSEDLAATLGDSQSVVLIVEAWESRELLACVHLKKKNAKRAYLGMLTVKPTLQARGLGRRLLHESESWVRSQWGLLEIEMTVIDSRSQLLDWYERRGYVRTGDFEAFPMHEPRFGVPKVAELRFCVLTKTLQARD